MVTDIFKCTSVTGSQDDNKDNNANDSAPATMNVSVQSKDDKDKKDDNSSHDGKLDILYFVLQFFQRRNCVIFELHIHIQYFNAQLT